jgi:hypothetical protein
MNMNRGSIFVYKWLPPHNLWRDRAGGLALGQRAPLELVMKISGMTREVAQTVPASWFESLAIKKDSIAPNYDTLVSTGMMTKKFPIEDVIATLPF